jgi:hypothetical protein
MTNAGEEHSGGTVDGAYLRRRTRDRNCGKAEPENLTRADTHADDAAVVVLMEKHWLISSFY